MICYIGVDEGNFHAVGEGFFLLGGHFWAEIRNHHVVAGEHAVGGADAVGLATANVGDFHFFCGCRIGWGIGCGFADMPGVDGGAVQADANLARRDRRSGRSSCER